MTRKKQETEYMYHFTKRATWCYNEQEVRKRKGLFERWDEQ